MAILKNGKFCDYLSQRRPGAREVLCERPAHHELIGLAGSRLQYCNKHIEVARRRQLREQKESNYG